MKVTAHGPLFRYERPQKGRYRQFHQIDAEIIGAAEPQADVELLAMADQVIRELGITGVTLHLNTLGDGDTRAAWRAALIDYFGAVKGELSEDSQERLEKNPLRILDSKDPRDRKFVADAPKIDAYLSDEARSFFDAVTSGLDAAGVKWVRAESLVRGLDYYRHTAFEFIPDEGSEAASKLGSQSTILGGGRYDGLMESLGGAPTPAVGWAAGIERLAMLVGGADVSFDPTPVLAVIPDSPSMRAEADRIASHLRSNSAGDYYIWTAYRQHGRKLADKAKSDGVDSILFVRDLPDPSERLHLTNLTAASGEAIRELFYVLGRLPEPYRSIEGEG
jgi:histidyl-tRNA synthetase